MLPKWAFSQGKAAASKTHTVPISPTRLKLYLLLCVSVLITFFFTSIFIHYLKQLSKNNHAIIPSAVRRGCLPRRVRFSAPMRVCPSSQPAVTSVQKLLARARCWLLLGSSQARSRIPLGASFALASTCSESLYYSVCSHHVSSLVLYSLT